MARSEKRLPRGKNADRPRPDEKVLWKTGVDLNNGWLGRHGTLYLTDQRILFVPTPLDHLLGAKRREIPRDRLQIVERWPLNPGHMPPGAKRPRLYLYADGVKYQFIVGDLDAWFDIIEVVFTKAHAQDPTSHVPEFRRQGIENGLMDGLMDVV